MENYADLYGVAAEESTFRRDSEAFTDSIAEQLMEVLDVDLTGWHSESRGGIVYVNTYDPDIEEHDIEVHLHPNHVIESDGDYWVEEQHKQFALLLYIGCERKDLIDRTRMAIKGVPDLNLTLIRSTYSPNLESGEPDVVTFFLTPEPAAEQEKR